MKEVYFAVFGAFVGWLPGIYFWARDRFTSTRAEGISSVVLPIDRYPGAQYKCKIRVSIKNERQGPIRLSEAYFVFGKRRLLRPDPIWAQEIGSGRFGLHFFCKAKNEHVLSEIYLRPEEKTDAWIALDPIHADADIFKATESKAVGLLYFRLTRWRETGTPKARWVRMEV